MNGVVRYSSSVRDFLRQVFLKSSSFSVDQSLSVALPSFGGDGAAPSGVDGFALEATRVSTQLDVGLVGENMLGFCAPPGCLPVVDPPLLTALF